MGLHKTKTSAQLKDKIKWRKKSTKWERTLSRNTSERGMTYKFYLSRLYILKTE